ncbi:unnamed protein product [Discula destructiva]
MLLRSLPPALLAMAGLIKAQKFSELSYCGQTCINNMDTTTGCVPVTAECLCANKNFIFGITDCANAACDSADAEAAVKYASASCASVLSTSATAAATTTEPTSTAETPTTAPTTAPAETASKDADSTATQSAQTSVAATSSDSPTAATPASATGVRTTPTAESSSGSEPTGASAAATSNTAAAASSSSSPSSSSSSGLSPGAKTGIIVGALVAAAGVVGFILYLSRKRQPPPRSSYKISPPLPGAGRVGDADDEWERFNHPQYSPPPPRNVYSAGSNMSELDRSARPYEDMVPRTIPARMV